MTNRVKRIEDFLASRDLRPNVKHWLTKISREIERHWKKVTEKWPEPWSFEQGGIELLDGEIVFGDGTRLKARLSLWCRYRFGPSDLSDLGRSRGGSRGQSVPFHLGCEPDRNSDSGTTIRIRACVRVRCSSQFGHETNPPGEAVRIPQNLATRG